MNWYRITTPASTAFPFGPRILPDVEADYYEKIADGDLIFRQYEGDFEPEVARVKHGQWIAVSQFTPKPKEETK